MCKIQIYVYKGMRLINFIKKQTKWWRRSFLSKVNADMYICALCSYCVQLAICILCPDCGIYVHVNMYTCIHVYMYTLCSYI